MVELSEMHARTVKEENFDCMEKSSLEHKRIGFGRGFPSTEEEYAAYWTGGSGRRDSAVYRQEHQQVHAGNGNEACSLVTASSFSSYAEEDYSEFVASPAASDDNEEEADRILAELIEMGYSVETANQAIRDCGSLDIATIIEFMHGPSLSSGERTAVCPVTDSSFVCNFRDVKEEQLFVLNESEATEVGQLAHNSRKRLKTELSEGLGFRSTCADNERDAFPHVSAMDASVQEQACPSHALLPQAGPSCKPHVRKTRTVSLHFGNSSCDTGKDNKGKSVEDVDYASFGAELSDEDSEEAVDSRYEIDTGKEKWDTLWRMGFPEKLVCKAFRMCGDSSSVDVLANYILSRMVDNNDTDSGSEEDEEANNSSKPNSVAAAALRKMGFSARTVGQAVVACGENTSEEELLEHIFREQEDDSVQFTDLSMMAQLRVMGFSADVAKKAIDINGDADIAELVDYIHADQLVGDGDDVEVLPTGNSQKKKKTIMGQKAVRRKDKTCMKSPPFAVPVNMTGYGIPGQPAIPRKLDLICEGGPYFYFENVASMPKDEWNNIKRHLYNVEPEFVDSRHFSACRRPRGYIHNLPVEGRMNLLPKPPMTIQELIPGVGQHWPEWDPRTKLNCINTKGATDFVHRQVKESLRACENGDVMPNHIKIILFWARKWNLVWIRPGRLAPLNPEEVETCLGFDPNHTRVLFSSAERLKVLGNTFQVNTIAYHLSVLRQLFPQGIRVLSLFSGIGGAEVALNKLGVPLQVVVSVEKDDKPRRVLESWWSTTNQKGKLITDFHDVVELDSTRLSHLLVELGGFDLIIGGSPCNNLSGNNRCTRVGLGGESSVMFFEFPRIVTQVRTYMAGNRA